MTEYFTWVVAAAALLGTWLNVQRDRRCFFIWIGTNGFWAGYDAWHGLYSQAVLFAVYFVMAIAGLIKWENDAGN
jgi:hypothetical protein